MSIVSKEDLIGVEYPEIIVGLCAAVGTPLDRIQQFIENSLLPEGYETTILKLSDYLSSFNLPVEEVPAGAGYAERVDTLMTRGNELRKAMGGGDALAVQAAADIHSRRPTDPPRALEKKAFIIRQLKHPDEALLLRRIYSSGFHQLSVYCPESVRRGYLTNHKNVEDNAADALIKRDYGEEIELGQHVTKTFHKADCFVELSGVGEEAFEETERQIRRYFDLVFGRHVVTPTVDEYGMFLAHSASLRSSDLSRQVGAAILSSQSDVISLGVNEVPRAHGGQYWEGDENDDRDFVRKYDSNEVIRLESVTEALKRLGVVKEDSESMQDDIKAAIKRLSGTRIMELTEFGRAVHAEMEAILGAARQGVSAQNADLYTTTFPCHNCAKHIVGVGIKRVVYIEPYAKSLANRLHGDSIAISVDGDTEDGKIPFVPFSGVAPRTFPFLFSTMAPDGDRLKRKDHGGQKSDEPLGLRMAASPLSHVERETIVAGSLDSILQNLDQLLKD